MDNDEHNIFFDPTPSKRDREGMKPTPDVTIPEAAYNIKPDAVVDLRGSAPVNPSNISKHKHVIVQWEGGELWLDMSEQSNHFCVDVRQFNPDDKMMKGQGAFTIVNGSRMSFGEASVYSTDDDRYLTTKMEPLQDRAGSPVTGHGWNGGYVISVLTDPNGQEKAGAPANSPGNG